MATCLLLTRNFVDEGTVTAGSASASLPVTNLQDRQPGKPWRAATTTAADTYIECDFGGAAPINAVAMINHNWNAAATWRVRLGNDATFATTEYDSGVVDAWPILHPFGSLPWGSFTWSGKPTVAEQAYYNNIPAYDLLTTVMAQYLRIDIDDSARASGYPQAGRLIAGIGWQPSRNFGYGWELTWEDDSTVRVSLGGQTYAHERARRRVIRLALSNVDADEMLANASDYMGRRKGVIGDVLFIPDPDQPTRLLHEAVYGRQRRLLPLVEANHVGRGQIIEIEEYI